MQKTVLVVGGAGFIGSYVNKLLDEYGYKTIVLDDLSHGNKKMACRGLFIEGSMGDAEKLKRIFSEYSIDAVIHFAAYIRVGESVENPLLYYQNNVVNTLTLLETIVSCGINNLIFSSSAAVYGNPQAAIIDENHPCYPINPYGKTKWMVENILNDFGPAYGLKHCSLRYFNVAGGDPKGEIKNYKENEGNLIPLIIRSIKENGSITIFGTDYPTPDGTCIRDYIHLHDLAVAHIKAMERLFQGKCSDVYNLGNNRGYSVKEVLDATEKVLKKKVHVVEGVRRPGDPAILIANAQKAQRELNWKPELSLENMIQDAWQALYIRDRDRDRIC